MLILYTKNNSKKCEDLKHAFEKRNLRYEERNVADKNFLKEAEELGATDMPFLFDPQANFKTGNVEDMIDYASEYAF